MGKNLHDESKRIIRLLDGVNAPREENERPDFVRLTKATNKKQKDIVVGIEHFRVDHLSEKLKNGTIRSTGIMHEKDVHNAISKWGNKVVAPLPSEAVDEFWTLTGNQIKRRDETSYGTFIETLRSTLAEHYEKAEAYKENIRKACRADIKLAFLIEVHTEFDFLYLNDDRGRTKNTSGLMPM